MNVHENGVIEVMHRNSLRALLAALACGILTATAAPPTLTPEHVVAGLSLPSEIANANDGSGRLFVIERAGLIRIIKDGQLLPTPFLDISAANGGDVMVFVEAGLLGLAFHPDYARNGIFFIAYNRVRGLNVDFVVKRYRRSAANEDLADPTSAVALMELPGLRGGHNGGKLAFGPDGYLYWSTGDGQLAGDPMDAQSLADLRGKILRLDIDNGLPYAIPATNPYAGSTDPAIRPEIWARGFRNPWRFSFDRVMGDLFIGDVGEGQREEVSLELRGSSGGRNYGWGVFEGTACFIPPVGCTLADHTPPIIEYGRLPGIPTAIIGGYVYRGAALPELFGYYLYGDFPSGHIWAAAPDASGIWRSTLVATYPNLSAFGEDESGELYVANVVDGTLAKLTPGATAGFDGELVPRYRLYNPAVLDHLYTSDFNEYSVLPRCCSWLAEGPIYIVLSGPGSIRGVTAVPNYRLYNRASFQHHWTTDANEYAVLTSLGWIAEGIDGYVLPSHAPGTVPLHRLYLGAAGGLHLWTTDANERDTLVASFGWIYEGVAAYVLPVR